MGSRWNVDGVLSMSEIPAEFADFVKAKRQQLATNILSSAAAGVVLANVAALFAGDASLAVLGETVQARRALGPLSTRCRWLQRATHGSF